MNKRLRLWLALTLSLTGPWAVGVAQPSGLAFTEATVAGSQLILSWTGPDTGLAYTVQSRDQLQGDLWINVPWQAPWPIPQNHWTDPRPVQANSRFYRVVAVAAPQRGRLLSSTLIQALSQSEIGWYLALQGIPITPQYGVRVYKLVYETTSPLGARQQASGALVVPQNPGRAAPLLSYQHGTLTTKAEAPSATLYGETFIGVAFASVGYVCALPDYLGLGDSPGPHFYHHASSEASAGVDMLRAAVAHCRTNGPGLNGQLFLTGYSQGGHATLALHRELESFHAAEFTVTAAAPMAGAYDLSGVTAADFLSGRAMPNPYYFPYLLASYQAVYHLTNTLADLLTPPYNTTLPPLLSAQAPAGQINAATPNPPTLILEPHLLAAFRTDPNHPLRAALRDNDLHRWTPRAPLRLYHCHGDQDVAWANSQVARDGFVGRGATQTQLIDPNPTADHGDCVLPSLLLARQWFESLRQ